MSERRLIVGLGNPGRDYEGTRHNLGFLVVDRLGQQEGLTFTASSSCKGLVAEGMIFEKTCCLLLPQIFMNNSGIAVKQFAAGKNIALEDILIVCDDFHLDFGQLRIRSRGSDGGHNGLHSVIHHLQTEDVARLRVGVGPVPLKRDAADFVLQSFSANERKRLADVVQDGTDCCAAWLTKEFDQVMSQFNKRNANE